MKLSKAIDAFLLHLSANGYSINTISLYTWAMKMICNYLTDPDLTAITPSDMDHFWSWLRNDYKPQRKNKKKIPWQAGQSIRYDF